VLKIYLHLRFEGLIVVKIRPVFWMQCFVVWLILIDLLEKPVFAVYRVNS